MKKTEIPNVVELDADAAASITGGSTLGTYWEDIKNILKLPPMEQDQGI
jgi:hypothetical protein